MKLRTSLLLGILLALLGYAGGLYQGRGSVKVVTVEGKTIEKVVEKVVTVTVVKRPDGTVETVTRTEDRVKDKTKEKQVVSKTPILPQWGVGGGANARFGSLTKPEYYGIVSRRVLGPAWLELQGSSKHLGLGVRVEF